MAEAHFVCALDSAQEYLELQEQLGISLRAGFLNLAKARYAMGIGLVSALQLPSQMHATKVLRRAGDGTLSAIDRAGGGASDAAHSATCSDRPTASAKCGGVLEELAAKYGCELDSAVAEPDGDAAAAVRPISWFGASVPPALRDAERDFTQVLEIVVELVNAKRKLVHQVEGCSVHEAAKV